jgi:AraC-like DNA-binding protein
VDPRIRFVKERIEENPLLELEILLAETKLSRSRLDEIFAKEVGQSIGRYSRGKRLELSAGLLKASDLSIKEIAHRIGYQHASSFIRAFGVRFRVGPTEYRRSHKR